MTANTRLKVGLAFAIGGNLLFFTGWWLWMPWSATVKTTLAGILFFAPEVGTLICIAIIGKENYQRAKDAALTAWREFRAGQKEAGEKKETEPKDGAEEPKVPDHEQPPPTHAAHDE